MMVMMLVIMMIMMITVMIVLPGNNLEKFSVDNSGSSSAIRYWLGDLLSWIIIIHEVDINEINTDKPA